MIEKLNFSTDLSLVKADVNHILTLTQWGDENQIGLTHRPNAKNGWKDAIGSMFSADLKDRLGNEWEFTEFHKDLPPTLKQILLDFAAGVGIRLGRIRLMKLPSKRGLTVHRDTSVRYHLVLDTNIDSFFGFRDLKQVDGVAAKCYHIPADGHFYKVDTTKFHFVYNGGKTERTHIVIVPR
jgi:hypothetical protein